MRIRYPSCEVILAAFLLSCFVACHRSLSIVVKCCWALSLQELLARKDKRDRHLCCIHALHSALVVNC